jgi:hypothetical protein
MSFRRIRQKIDDNHSPLLVLPIHQNSPLKHKTHFIRQFELFKECCELRIALHPISFNIFICLRSADLLTALRDQDRGEDKP